MRSFWRLETVDTGKGFYVWHSTDFINTCNVTVGLIIDAFGELRDQQEQVKEDMEVQCNTLS